MRQFRRHSFPALMALAAILSLLLPEGLSEGAACAHHGSVQVRSAHGDSGVQSDFQRDYNVPSINVDRSADAQSQGCCPFCAPSLHSLEPPNPVTMGAWALPKAGLREAPPLSAEAPRPPPLLNAPKLGPPARA